MNKYIANISATLAFACALCACSADEGTDPGNNSTPVVTIYDYTPSSDDYSEGQVASADNDIKLRFVANNAVESAYYIAEKTATRDSYVDQNGESAYAEYVIENGTKLTSINGFSDESVLLTELYGDYTITAVAVSAKGARHTSSITFSGLDWNTVATGTYKFAYSSALGLSSSTTVDLQVCTTNDKMYRFKDLYGAGYNLKFTLLSVTGVDDDGDAYTYARIPDQVTPFTYNGISIYVSDVGYWQQNDAYITQAGYEGCFYEGYVVALLPVYRVPGVGSFGYQKYETFIPNN